MSELPIELDSISNDGLSVRFALRCDDGQLRNLTIPHSQIDEFTEVLVRALMSAALMQHDPRVQETEKHLFKDPPQLFRAKYLHFSADLGHGGAYLVVDTLEKAVLQISLNPVQLERLIDLAQQCQNVQSTPEANN